MKRELRITDTLPKIKSKLGVTNFELANLLGISERSVNYYLGQEQTKISDEIFNKIVKLIENKNLDLFDLFDLDGDKYLFHASREGIIGKITTTKNKEKARDFDFGFYLSESFKVAATYVDDEEEPHIYRFLKKDVLVGNRYLFEDNLEGRINWVLFIGLSRKKIVDLADKNFLTEYFNELFENKDLLIGKIADSFNFDVMDDFFDQTYDINQVSNALRMVDIGNQYVLKNEEHANKLKYVDDFTLDSKLKDYIHDWHIKQNVSIKKSNKNLLDKDKKDDSLTFGEVLKNLKGNYEQD